MSDVLLWHFPISHFNEKVRWALDLKHIPHRRRALGPDYLVRAWWATGRASLPVLFVDGRAIGDSTRIIAALEELRPVPPLYPQDPAARRRALEIEDWLDEDLGPAVRSAIMGRLFTTDPAAAVDVLTTGMPAGAGRALRGILPAFRVFYLRRHGIDGARADDYLASVRATLDRLARDLGGRDYLVGDGFSIADLTAASFLAPVVWPPELEYRPASSAPAVVALREAIVAHPMARWTLEIYRRHRGVSAEVARG